MVGSHPYLVLRIDEIALCRNRLSFVLQKLIHDDQYTKFAKLDPLVCAESIVLRLVLFPIRHVQPWLTPYFCCETTVR